MFVPMAVMSEASGVAEGRDAKAGALDVQDLAAAAQDGLRLAVARLLGAATCGIALYKDFGLFGLLDEQSASLPGRAGRSSTPLRRVIRDLQAAS